MKEDCFTTGYLPHNRRELNTRLLKHATTCHVHKCCVDVNNMHEKGELAKCLKNSVEKQFNKVEKRHPELARLLRTAYRLIKKNISLRSFPELVDMQSENGLKMGSTNFSRKAAKNFAKLCASVIKRKLVYIIEKDDLKFAIMADESTSVKTTSILVQYIRLRIKNDPVTLFWSMSELSNTDAETISNEIENSLSVIDDIVVKRNFVALCVDGASCMLGRLNGVAARLKEKFPNLLVVHCLAHRLELCVGDVLKTNGVGKSIEELKSLLKKLAAFYKRSPKMLRELRKTANGSEVKAISRIFTVRWSASTSNALRSLIHNQAFLLQHFQLVKKTNYEKGKKSKHWNSVI